MTAEDLMSHLCEVGNILAASPRECMILNWINGKVELNIEPALCRRLIQELGYRITWLPQNDWYDMGRVGWRRIFPPETARHYAQAGFDFFCVTQ